MKRVDHVKASREFIADAKHIELHDKRLWTLRNLRDEAAHGIEEWEQLRSFASGIKEHTLTHLADYLEEFERNATNNGVIVHWAKDAEEHNRIVHEILGSHGVKTLVKSKSMLTEECGMREYLEPRGITVVETDLGERIQQRNEMLRQIAKRIDLILHFAEPDRSGLGDRETRPHNTDIDIVQLVWIADLFDAPGTGHFRYGRADHFRVRKTFTDLCVEITVHGPVRPDAPHTGERFLEFCKCRRQAGLKYRHLG
jgi:hypothetical protein